MSITVGRENEMTANCSDTGFRFLKASETSYLSGAKYFVSFAGASGNLIAA